MFNEYADLRHRSHVGGLGGHGEQAETEARSPSAELEGVIFPEEVLELHSLLDSSSNWVWDE